MRPMLDECMRGFLRRSWCFFVLYIALLGSLLLMLVSQLRNNDLVSLDPIESPNAPKALVLAKTRDENVSWTDSIRWKPYIYTVDNEDGFIPVPANKGREGMAYLTHIIDNYDNLADITAFMHASAKQWHNDIGDTTTSNLLSRLRPQAIKDKGYSNLRCDHRPGCPIAVRPFDEEYTSKHNIVYKDFATFYADLFRIPIEQVPREVGGVCCGQFAVSRERIRQRSREEYIQMREWALTSSLHNFAIGSVLEMVWHVIFMEDYVS
ncbi:hypothetical protein MW887_003562 [Aspergillus wentii]|nr:hypothetical protein MW887_003562 [Aspergillus wentii]